MRLLPITPAMENMMPLALKQWGNVDTAIASGSQANRVPGMKQQAAFEGVCLTCARSEHEHVAVEAHSA